MISISQSMIKAFRVSGYCPMKLKKALIDKTHPIPGTPTMDKGVFFETLCLGSGVHGKTLNTLPLLKNGNKSAAHQRIEAQAAKFPEILKSHKMVIDQKDLYLEYELPSGIWINGTIDFTSSIWDDVEGPIPKALVDLKLTGNINSNFGDFCWGTPFKMDHTQAAMYSVLYKLKFGIDIPFYYLIFDYKPVPEYKIIKKVVGILEREALKTSITSTVDKIKFHDSTGWFTHPSHDNCKNCPLAAQCSDFTQATKIQTI